MNGAEAIFAIEGLGNFLKGRFPAAAGVAEQAGKNPVEVATMLLETLPPGIGVVPRCEACKAEATSRLIYERVPTGRFNFVCCETCLERALPMLKEQLYAVSIRPLKP